MASVAGINGFNNLLFQTKLRGLAEELEHAKGHQPLDLSFKGYGNINNVLTAKASQINGKRGDILYKPKAIKSRPDFSYDARLDPTTLNSVRNKLVDVSGRFIPNRDFKKNTGINSTQRPLNPVGVIH